MTLNKEIINFLDKDTIYKYISKVEMGKIKPVDVDLNKKIQQVINKSALKEKEKIIQELKEIGYDIDEDDWNLYTLDQLKYELKRIK